MGDCAMSMRSPSREPPPCFWPPQSGYHRGAEPRLQGVSLYLTDFTP
jgi:hypothetical protein